VGAERGSTFLITIYFSQHSTEKVREAKIFFCFEENKYKKAKWIQLKISRYYLKKISTTLRLNNSKSLIKINLQRYILWKPRF